MVHRLRCGGCGPTRTRRTCCMARPVKVPALPHALQVVPVLLQLTRSADDLQRRIDMVKALTELVTIMRQHISRYLKDFLDLVHDFWSTSTVMQPHLLALIGELSRTDGAWGWGGGGGGCLAPRAICMEFSLAGRARCRSSPRRSGTTAWPGGRPTHPLPTSTHTHGLADVLQDDFKPYMPDLLPKFVAIFNDAERTGDFTMVRVGAGTVPGS